ncbi:MULTISPECIES: hypothetical protein [Xanthomonas]|uniref:hypothetical protein n=1 Tax=Xanthomonas TaxID=338 RepID=UPI001364D215|nr:MULTISPECIES: hypothetical protein [Xanthomonas]MBO9771938.1 hypothetical protein [Xanthomonas axonopodis pv. begoniae]MCC8468625.1 hypothetical protein [Xanthomonas phaseoli]MBO9734575.1 hypothetical protein [Xanthomonas phaseoli pv. phaseoli]MDM4801296.1 hypothetical protein [Xanthomonas phaseoli pv. phaseoli]MDM4806330.1 hypothetical protein [Xanthomonas phaseoli pv. phaseoli]
MTPLVKTTLPAESSRNILQRSRKRHQISEKPVQAVTSRRIMAVAAGISRRLE